jgi:prepilin-type N-terminal cleavage/methylation domain-containing protein
MRAERGFSLAELLMALLILTIVITTSMAAFVERNRRQRQAREIILAYQALANESEYWRRIRFDNLERDLDFQSDLALLEPLGNVTTIVAVERTQPDVKNVTLTIRWQEGKRLARLGIVRVNTGGSGLW